MVLTCALVPASTLPSTVSVSPNPALPIECGLDIAFSLDLSNSVQDAQLVQMKDGVAGIAEDMQGMPISISVHPFASQAPVATQNGYLPRTSVAAAAGVAPIADNVRGLQRPAPGVERRWDDGRRARVEGRSVPTISAAGLTSRTAVMTVAGSRSTRPNPVALTLAPDSTARRRWPSPSACMPRWSMVTHGSAWTSPLISPRTRASM